MDTKPYLEYLDKEMTIMGILSAVCVAAPAGILSTIVTKDGDVAKSLWQVGHFFIVSGSAFSVLASLFFYKERSLLAWYHGQICFAEAMNSKSSKLYDLRVWFRDADSWETWVPYSWGFTFLDAAFAQYLFALIFLLAPTHWDWLAINLHMVKVWVFWLSPIVATATATVQWHVLSSYSFSDTPYADFWNNLFRAVEPKRSLPHEGVYTRIKPSSIHGVGVFAIIDIPEGTSMFEPDDDELIPVPKANIKAISPALRKLYRDFCIRKAGEYLCPPNFNVLTPAWYLNTSKNPNVVADQFYKFRALHDIKGGEELTADYDTYSEREAEDDTEANES